MTLVSGQTYRAELDLPWYASQSMAQSKLQSAGFTSVQIYSSGGTLYVQGVWSGTTQDIDLPDQLKNPVLVSS